MSPSKAFGNNSALVVLSIFPESSLIYINISPQISQITCLHAPQGLPPFLVAIASAVNFVCPLAIAL